MTSSPGQHWGSVALAAGAAALASSAVTALCVRRACMARRSGSCHGEECSLAGGEGCGDRGANGIATRTDPYSAAPRAGYLSWDDYFMAVAFLSAQRSKDPHKQVGACIVDTQNVISGIGYNGFPRGCPDSKLPWSKASRTGNPLDTKYPFVCHAEMNAMLNKNGASVAGARIYVTLFPCNECAKLMIQAGISEVVYHEDKGEMPRPDGDSGGQHAAISRRQQYAASRKLLGLAGVKLRQHRFARRFVLDLGPDP